MITPARTIPANAVKRRDIRARSGRKRILNNKFTVNAWLQLLCGAKGLLRQGFSREASTIIDSMAVVLSGWVLRCYRGNEPDFTASPFDAFHRLRQAGLVDDDTWKACCWVLETRNPAMRARAMLDFLDLLGEQLGNLALKPTSEHDKPMTEPEAGQAYSAVTPPTPATRSVVTL